jgi:Viral BACON domain
MDCLIQRLNLPRAFVLFVSALLAACGGGGGDGGGGNNPGTGGGFTLGASAASFSAREKGALPTPQNISITLTGGGSAQLGAAFPAGQVPAWLTVDITGSAPNYTLVLTVNTTDLSPAQRTATVLVGTADSSGNILRSQQVTVNYDLASNVQVASTPSSAVLVFGSSQITQALNVPVTAQNKTWTITSNVSWLQGLPAGNQTGTQILNLTLNAANLAVNSYTGTLTVQNTADAADHASVTITLNVLAPTLTVTPDSVVLGGPDGLGNTNKNLVLTLDTGTNTHPYTVVLSDTGGIGWLKSSVPGGTVGSNASSIVLDADRSTGIRPGEYSGSARFEVNVNGTTFSTTVPVALNLESHRLVVENGVALAKFPSRQVLSRTLKVTSSRNRTDVPWSAQSNQGWLTVTQPGAPVVGDNLTLTANPTGLSNGQHIALVTLHSTDPTIDRDETIRVGFWVGAVDPTDVEAALTAQPVVLITNPVEPLAYVHTLGTNIFVYNVYTGVLQNTFTIGVAGQQAEAMSISSDGRVLYVLESITRVIYGLDAVTGAQVSMFNTNPNIFFQGSAAKGLSYMRPNGYPLVLTPYGETFDVETGSLINTSGALQSLRSFSGDYGLAYSLYFEFSPATPTRSPLGYSALHGKVFTIAGGAVGAMLSGPGGDVCAGGTGSRVYVFPGGGYVSVLDPTTLANIAPDIPHPSGAFFASLACARNGNVYVGTKSLPIGDDDIQAFDASGASLGTFRAGPDFLDLDQLRLSGDETRFASGYERFNFGQFAIAFRSVPN